MKPMLSLVALFLIITNAQAQSFAGYRSGNYTGVNGVFFNPAYAANSRYHWDLNLLQVNASVYNNAASYKLSSITNNFNSNKILNKLYGSRNARAFVNADVLGPSLLFNINSNTAFAFTTRYRLFGNLRQVDGNLLQAIKNDDGALPSFDIRNNNMQVAATGWMEAGFTWANVLYTKDKHFLKGGISIKYLGGIANAAISTNNLNASVGYDATKDSYFAGTASGNINLLFAGASPGNLAGNNLTKFNGKGAGFDIGLSYEYRPKCNRYKVADGSYDRGENIYTISASVALLDIGNIRFNSDPQRSGNYTANITGTNQFDLSTLNTDIDRVKDAFEANPTLFTPVGNTNGNKYKVSLPATLMTEADYHFSKGLYLNVASHLSLARSNDVYKMTNLNSVVVTPRMETPFLGIYLPLQVNNITGFDAGAALRFGPLVVGSSNIVTAIGSSKMVNVYIGFRLMGSKIK